MANFITTEANKNSSVTNGITNEISNSYSAEAVNAGSLLGATASAFGNLINTAPDPKLKLISIAITTANGTALNYGVNISKDGDNLKAVITGGVSATVSVLAAETLGALVARTLGTVAVGAIAVAGTPVTVVVASAIAVVGVSYLAGSAAGNIASYVYDKFITPETQVINDKVRPQSTIETTKTLEQSMQEFNTIITAQNQNWDIRATIPSVSNPESYVEQLKYDANIKEATVKTSNETTLNEGTILLLKKDINQITINNHTADVATPTNLQLRNALTSIDDYQFLLSNILIKVGEKLDMGAAGVITVSSGDTLSQLAVQHLGGNAVDATREAVLLNPWLADYGRIKFNDDINKVLIKDGAVLNDNNNDHTLIGENADDLLIDRNGGEDTLIGNAGDDYLDGGSGADTLVGGRGYDTYITNNEDMIFDEDGSGIVKFEGLTLAGGKEIEGQSGVYRCSSGEVYTLTSDGNLEDIDDGSGDIIIEVSSVSADEGDSGTQSGNVTVSLSEILDNAIMKEVV